MLELRVPAIFISETDEGLVEALPFCSDTCMFHTLECDNGNLPPEQNFLAGTTPLWCLCPGTICHECRKPLEEEPNAHHLGRVAQRNDEHHAGDMHEYYSRHFIGPDE